MEQVNTINKKKNMSVDDTEHSSKPDHNLT